MNKKLLLQTADYIENNPDHFSMKFVATHELSMDKVGGKSEVLVGPILKVMEGHNIKQYTACVGGFALLLSGEPIKDYYEAIERMQEVTGVSYSDLFTTLRPGGQRQHFKSQEEFAKFNAEYIREYVKNNETTESLQPEQDC